VFAADVRSCKPELVPEEVRQEGPRLGDAGTGLAVDDELD
jgi:hypothetical protein